MNLERALARWRAAGLIDDSTSARIAAFERTGRTPIVRSALGVLGAGAVALGVVSVIAANWDVITGRAKLAGDLALGALLAAATFVAVQRERGWASEVLITLFYGFTLASIGLVGQVYQLDAPAYQGLLVWSAATLPLALLGRSRYLAVLVLAGLALTHALSLPALFEWLEHRAGLAESTVLDVAATLVFASPLLYLALARVPWLVRARPELSRAATAFGWAAVLAGGFTLQLLWYTDIKRHDTLGWSLAATAVLAAAFCASLPRLYPELAPRSRRALAAILGVAWLSLALGAGFPRESANVVGAMLQLVWLGLFAWASIQLGLVRLFNLFTALIALRLLVVYFEVFGSLLSTGVGLIGGGMLTLLVGWRWRRKTDELAARLNPSPERGGDVA